MSCPDEPRPAGRLRRIDRGRVVGHGPDDFAEAARVLRSFRVHRAAGIDVRPPGAVASNGAVVVLRIGYRRAAIEAPCRVVDSWYDEHGAGFRYVALDGHPVSGWEEFSVVLAESGGSVTFAITAESEPASTFGRLLRPVHERMQDRIVGAYLDAMSGLVSRR